jgi:hypothetical protein
MKMMKLIKRRSTLICGLIVSSLLSTTIAPTQACLNDRDVVTLAQASTSLRNPAASAGLPDTVWIITGRFERNPALYYEMRIQQTQKELVSHPKKLDLYDDIAVAYGRLNKDSEAIAWMNKKHAQLERVASKENLSNPEYKEQWYRYHANIGTFYAHRWLKTKDRSHMADMQTGFKHIARGLEIKPDAHFGREPVQLAAMEWILSGCKETLGERLRSYQLKNITESQPGAEAISDTYTKTTMQYFRDNPMDKIRTGLSGLVALGAAWESVDAFKALAGTLNEDYHVANAPLSDFALWRAEELRQKGRASMEVSEKVLTVTPDPILKKQFQMLRTNADAWQENRTAYMMTRLKSGKHPDTDPTFWQDYKELPKPSLELSKEDQIAWRAAHPKPVNYLRFLGALGPIVALGLALGFVVGVIAIFVKIILWIRSILINKKGSR